MLSKFQPAALPGTLHHYAPSLTAFEHAASSSESDKRNYLLFLGGLSDGLRTTAYPLTLHHSVNPPDSTSPPWSVVEVLLSSSYAGWETSSLQRDADELSLAVEYFSKLQPDALVVLMGHSTGCQVATYYLAGPHNQEAAGPKTLARPLVDGVILQAGISDREGLLADSSIDNAALEAAIARAREQVATGRGEQRVLDAPAPLAHAVARRLLSLASPVRDEADDDFFSSDLDDAHVARVWGAAGLAGRHGRRPATKLRVMVLLSDQDEHMPEGIDKQRLSDRWGAAVKAGGGAWDEASAPVPGASHGLGGNPPEVVAELCGRVTGYLRRLEGQGA